MTTRQAKPRPDSSSCGRNARALRARSALTASWIALLVVLASGCDRTLSLDEVRALHSDGRYADTIEPLRKQLEKTPDDAEAHLLYGTALSRTGAARVAVWSLRKAAETPEWMVPATLELSGAHAHAGNWSEAIAAADAVLEVEPDNLPAHVLRGEAFLNEGEQTERALEDFDFVLNEDPTSRPALNSRASALLLLGKVEEAAETIDQLEALAAKNPGDQAGQAELCAVQAVLRQERGELDEAEKRFEECLERFPSDSVVVDSAITFFDTKGERERSDALLAKALELAPQSLSYRRTLALRVEAAGDPARALSLLKQGLESEDRELRIAVWTDITNYHLKRDELPEAIEAFEQALSMVDDPPQLAILTHADLLARAERNADALRVAKGLENDAYLGLIEARIALNEGDPKRALARLDQVFPLWPNNAGARYYAARAAEQTGDFARAIEEYRQSIRSAPDETEAALRLAKLYLAAGSYEEAWSNAGQYISVHRDDPEGARVMVAAAAKDEKATLHALFAQLRGTTLWPAAVAARARFVAEKRDPPAALAWITEIPGPAPDWNSTANAELLRTRVLLLQAAGRGDEAEKAIAEAVAAQPKSSEFREIQAALLEAKGGDPAAIRAVYEDAVAKDARNWLALEGVARARERVGDTRGALEFFDRATKTHLESPLSARGAAELAARMGDKADSERRWSELLKEHPWDASAARALASFRTERGLNDEMTLDFAERAVMFGGGKDAETLLIRVHEARGEVDRAREVARAFEAGKPIPPRKSKRGEPPPGGAANGQS